MNAPHADGMDPEQKSGTVSSKALQRLFRFVPALDSLRTYSLRSAWRDMGAGVTVAVVAVPQAMAYAMIAGLPPQVGLFTAIIVTAVGAIFDSSRQLINGPTNAISIALFSAIASVPENQKIEATVFMALMIGILQTLITILRFGELSRYISHAVFVGFTLGAAFLLFLDQVKHLLGVGDGQFDIATAGVGLATIILVLFLKWANTLWRVNMPGFMVSLVLVGFAVWALGLNEPGPWSPGGVATIGKIPSDLPELEWPVGTNTLERHLNLTGSAAAIAMLGLLEAIAMAKTIAARTGQKLDIKQQCLSEGLANVIGSFFHCMPGSGSLTRSAINVQAGAVSQWSGVFSALAVAITLTWCAPLANYVPRAALSAILIVSAFQLVDRKQLAYYFRATPFDRYIVMATAFAAVTLPIEYCILIGVLVSFVLFVRRATQLRLTEMTFTSTGVIRDLENGDPPCNRIAIFTLEGDLFFGSSPDLEGHLATILRRVDVGARVVVMRLKHASNPDGVSLILLEQFIDQLAQRNVRLLICGVRPELAGVLHDCGLEAKLGIDSVFLRKPQVLLSTLEAIAFAYELLSGEVCANCPRRSGE